MIASFIENSAEIIDTEVSPYCSWIRSKTMLRQCRVDAHVFIGHCCEMTWTVIGEGSQIAASTKIEGTKDKKVYIGKGVWIGAGARLASGVVVGDNAVIGAGAVVLENIPPCAIVVGRPSRIIRTRNFVYDGLPEFSEFMDAIRKQIITGVFQSKLECEVIKISESAHVFAEIFGIGSITISDHAVVMGRQNRDGIGGILLNGSMKIGSNCIVEAAGGLTCGDSVEIEDNVVIVTTSHDMGYESLPQTISPLKIGSRVTIGEGSIIVGGIEIGDDVCILPNSIINKSIPSGTTAMGQR